jgi:2-polyprenyl-3-methyl-5-hydroxy-6-metoxy-1,4-benzoquinol methylase
MSLVGEYKNQSNWRDWDPYLEKLPITSQDTICDMGCSIGVVTKKLAEKGHKVFGIDINPELIEEAKRTNNTGNIQYLVKDLTALNYGEFPHCDGIWSSFVASYFPDFKPVLNSWKHIMNPKGWLGIVEMNALLSHEPLSQSTRSIFQEYYKRQRKNKTYDFEMGSKIKDLILECGFMIIHEENMFDKELTFNGPAEKRIIRSWDNRFDRMIGFKEYVGKTKFGEIKFEFLNCLSKKEHRSNAIVKYIIATKK